MGVGAGARPNLMFFDVQEDQFPKLEKILKDNGTPITVSAPIVTMKIESLKGRPVAELLKEETMVTNRGPDGGRDGRKAGKGGGGFQMRFGAAAKSEPSVRDSGRIPAWTLTREYRSSYRAKIDESEKFPRVHGSVVRRPASRACRYPWRRDSRRICNSRSATRSSSTSKVCRCGPMSRVFGRWSGNACSRVFSCCFRKACSSPRRRPMRPPFVPPRQRMPRAQVAVARELPGISAIDLALILQTFDGIFAKVAFVITFMAGFTVVTGIVVLVGAILTGRFQRIRETVLLRTLGATRRQLTQIQLVEYTVLGVLATVTGGALAIMGNALLANYVFKTDVVLPVPALLASMAAAVAVTVITGLLANRGIADHPPLEVLRNET